MLKLNYLEIHTIHFRANENHTVFRNVRFVVSKVYSIKHPFYRLIIGVI